MFPSRAERKSRRQWWVGNTVLFAVLTPFAFAWGLYLFGVLMVIATLWTAKYTYDLYQEEARRPIEPAEKERSFWEAAPARSRVTRASALIVLGAVLFGLGVTNPANSDPAPAGTAAFGASVIVYGLALLSRALRDIRAR